MPGHLCLSKTRTIILPLERKDPVDKLRAIKLFCRAAEAKSFAAAAHDFDLAPSVISKAIGALEDDLRFRLFNRSTRRVALTEAGASYYESCRHLLSEFDEVEASARDGVVRAQGRLRIGVHPVLRLALMRRLGVFLAKHSGVVMETLVTNSPTALLDEGVDVVLAIGELADSGLVARKIGSTRWITCAARSYLDRAGNPKHPRDLLQHRALIPGRRDEPSFARWTYERGKEREVVNVPVALVARDGIGLAEACAGGAGVARIYDLSANDFLKAGTMESVLRDWSSRPMPVYAIILSSRGGVPAKVRLFLDFAHALLAEVDGTDGCNL
jgi:DNA-binding transcriptional LysR family regulator